jgi:hypothetical protein
MSTLVLGVDQDRILEFQETMSKYPLSLLQPLQLPYLHVIISVSSNPLKGPLRKHPSTSMTGLHLTWKPLFMAASEKYNL